MHQPVMNAREARDTFLFGRGAAWFAYGMTVALMILDYVDRQVIVSMFPFLKAEWNLSDAELGLLVSVISVTVAVFGIPSPRRAVACGAPAPRVYLFHSFSV